MDKKVFPSANSKKNKYTFDQVYSMLLLDTEFTNNFTKISNGKDDKQCNSLKTEANFLYSNKDFDKAKNLYTLALGKSTYNKELFGIALANRAAVFFELADYLNCIKDINHCFKSEYATKLRPKLFIRLAKCYAELGDVEKLKKCVENGLELLEKYTDIENKDKFKLELEQIQEQAEKNENLQNNSDSEAPSKIASTLLLYESNKNCLLFGATNSVKLSYNSKQGRHITATKDLQIGELLFVEKAFAFAPIFLSETTLVSDKCYYCLTTVLSSIPCKTCSLCYYCNESCQDNSWRTSHRWECPGMTTNLWYHSGIALPAFRALLKGISSGFEELGSNTEKLSQFGCENDNYKYFNSLQSHLDDLDEFTTLSHYKLAATTIHYLKTQTQFFDWVILQPNIPKLDQTKSVIFLGELLVKHIAQLVCNGSLIEHWPHDVITIEDFENSSRNPIASGIFPTVSLMNHSCKTNVASFFYKDTIIVRSRNKISKGEEIFNSYGVNYVNNERILRQETLRNSYNFDCNCEICCEPTREFAYYNSILCNKCSTANICNDEFSVEKCTKCFEKLPNFQVVKNSLLNKTNNKQQLIKVLPTHEINLEIYWVLYKQYLKNGKYLLAVNIVKKYFELMKIRLDHGYRQIGVEMFHVVSEILTQLQEGEKCIGNFDEYMKVHTIMEEMLQEITTGFSLYYPENKFVEELFLKFEAF